MFEDTRPAPDDGFVDDREAFRVTDPAEQIALLRQLLDRNTIVHLSGPDGSGITTTVWTVDAQQHRVSLSAEVLDPQLQRLVDAGEVTGVAYLDNVKLQFELTGLLLVHAERACALQAPLPRTLYRFQRRESFRVRTLLRQAATAHLRHPSLPDMPLALRVVDVSMGGCALLLPDDIPPITPGLRLHKVRIELDADTRFHAPLLLLHVTSIHPASGGARLGCSMSELDGDAQRALQRYIDQTQKRRRLLALD